MLRFLKAHPHPNIIQLISTNISDDDLSFTTPYYPGKTLTDHISNASSEFIRSVMRSLLLG